MGKNKAKRNIATTNCRLVHFILKLDFLVVVLLWLGQPPRILPCAVFRAQKAGFSSSEDFWPDYFTVDYYVS